MVSRPKFSLSRTFKKRTGSRLMVKRKRKKKKTAKKNLMRRVQMMLDPARKKVDDITD
jgi:hypothetical protein